MVGLSVVLEAQQGGGVSRRTPQVINKTAMMLNNNTNTNNNKSSSSSSSSYAIASSFSQHSAFPGTTFLEQCFLCRQKLLPGKDIYMYKGDRAFCSEECRCKQIFMDEEESIRMENCSFAAMKPTSFSSTASSSTSHHHHRKGPRNRAGAGGFAY